jgi:ABC-type transporter Mla subunit MlaD
MIWEVIWPIVLILFFLGLTVLIILLIPVILQVKESLSRLNQALDILNKDLPTVMTNVSDVSKTLNIASVKIEGAVDSFSDLERTINQQIRVPLKTIASIIATLLKILTAMMGRRKK